MKRYCGFGFVKRFVIIINIFILSVKRKTKINHQVHVKRTF